jgi:hypothetical protein
MTIKKHSQLHHRVFSVIISSIFFTIAPVIADHKLGALIVDPRLNLHKVSDKGRNETLEDRGIASHDVLFGYFGIVKLIHD